MMEKSSVAPSFEAPNFFERLRGMLGVDFYRLFHTPLFYIFLAIAAVIPAMILGTSNPGAGQSLYGNLWNIVAADTPLYVIGDIGEYANMNMVFIFGGIMVSIFIGHDYKSGYVKQLFTTHAKKQDYMISKTLVCAFAMACMCLTYLAGGVAGGLFVGLDASVNVGSLCLAIVGKMLMSFGWAALYTFLNVIFRRYFGLSILSSFFFGTGILVIGAAAAVENLSLPVWFLNGFLYGSSVHACLASNVGTLLCCLAVSAAWTVIWILLGTRVLSRCDVY